VFVAAFRVPFLLKEIRRGKGEMNPRIPTGAVDTHPGRRGNPASGKPDGQADPYDEEAPLTTLRVAALTLSKYVPIRDDQMESRL
jgi:hypothetical protein